MHTMNFHSTTHGSWKIVYNRLKIEHQSLCYFHARVKARFKLIPLSSALWSSDFGVKWRNKDAPAPGHGIMFGQDRELLRVTTMTFLESHLAQKQYKIIFVFIWNIILNYDYEDKTRVISLWNENDKKNLLISESRNESTCVRLLHNFYMTSCVFSLVFVWLSVHFRPKCRIKLRCKFRAMQPRLECFRSKMCIFFRYSQWWIFVTAQLLLGS